MGGQPLPPTPPCTYGILSLRDVICPLDLCRASVPKRVELSAVGYQRSAQWQRLHSTAGRLLATRRTVAIGRLIFECRLLIFVFFIFTLWFFGLIIDYLLFFILNCSVWNYSWMFIIDYWFLSSSNCGFCIDFCLSIIDYWFLSDIRLRSLDWCFDDYWL